MDAQHFKAEMDRLDLAYGAESNAGRRFIYFQRLTVVSNEAFSEAVNRIIDSERFFPTVATLHGYCDRIKDEWAALPIEEADDPRAIRLGKEVQLPECGTCLDARFIRIETESTNLPSRTEPCPDCGGPAKGVDYGRAMRERDAFLYLIERERAQYPPRNTDDAPKSAKELAERLSMDRLR